MLLRKALFIPALVLALGAAVGFAGTAVAEPSDLISVWQFDEDADEFASGTVRDSVDSNDGDVTGATSSSWPGAIFGRAIDLNGTSDQVTVPNADNLDFTSAYTLEGWVISDDTTLTNVYRPIFFRGADDNATSANDIEVYIQGVSKDLIVFHNRGNGGSADWVGFVDPPLGVWFHLAVVFDGTDVRAYYNGIAAGVTQHNTAMPAPLDTNKDWLFGKVNHSAFAALGTGRQQYFDGRLDEVRFWNSALTESEVAASYELGPIVFFGGVDMNSAKPGVEEVSTENVLTFFTASVYDVPTTATDVPVCISPDQDVDDVDIQISPLDAFTLRRWTPRPNGSSWNEGDSDTSVSGYCATVEDVDFGGPAKSLHLDLNLVDADTDAPLTGGTTTIVDTIGVNIQKNPLGG